MLVAVAGVLLGWTVVRTESARAVGAPQPRNLNRAAQQGEAKQGDGKAAPAPDLGALFRLHYDIRVRAFREQNQVFQNVVLVGDSITEGFDVLKYLPGRRVLNRGIGGDVVGNDLPAKAPARWHG